MLQLPATGEKLSLKERQIIKVNDTFNCLGKSEEFHFKSQNWECGSLYCKCFRNCKSEHTLRLDWERENPEEKKKDELIPSQIGPHCFDREGISLKLELLVCKSTLTVSTVRWGSGGLANEAQPTHQTLTGPTQRAWEVTVDRISPGF